MNAAGAEVVTARFHDEAENSHRAGLASQDVICNEVFACAVGADDGANQCLRHIVVVRQQLLGVFRQAITAVADTKTYDGTTTSTAVPTVGTMVAGDAVSTAPTQSYDNANAGDAHVLSVAPVTIKNGDVDVTANYAIS